MHHEEVYGNKIASPNSHPLEPTHKGNSLFMEGNEIIMKGMKIGSDEIKLENNKQSVSDPSNPNLVDLHFEQRNLWEGKFKK